MTTDDRLKDTPILFNLAEVAEVAGVTQRTLHNHIRKGTLKAFKVCGRWRVSKEDLEAFLYRER